MNTDININLGDLSDVKTKKVSWYSKYKDFLLFRVLVSFTLVSVFVYTLLCLTLFFYQDKFIFSPDRNIQNAPVNLRHSFKVVLIPKENNNPLYSWFIASPENRGTVLYCRGSKGNLSYDLHAYEKWHSAGYNVMTFDYQGFGLSYGKPSEENFYSDAEDAYKWLQSKGLTKRGKLILHGRAAGAAVAARLASKYECSGLIIESSFTSLKKLSKTKIPFLPSSLLRSEFPTEKFLGETDVPVLIMHSPEDEVVPYKMSKELFKTGSDSKKFFPLSGSHYNGYKLSNGYGGAIKDFADGLTQ